MIQEFVKKPVVIKAMKFSGSMDDVLFATAWVGKPLVFFGYVGELKSLEIQTLEGKMRALPGDFIIKGVNGEFYPCKPDIFEKSYEAVP